jgi:hypothetical protein
MPIIIIIIEFFALTPPFCSETENRFRRISVATLHVARFNAAASRGGGGGGGGGGTLLQAYACRTAGEQKDRARYFIRSRSRTPPSPPPPPSPPATARSLSRMTSQRGFFDPLSWSQVPAPARSHTPPASTSLTRCPSFWKLAA